MYQATSTKSPWKAQGSIVQSVEQGSISDKAGICIGDKIVSINGSYMRDILDYHVLVSEPYLKIEIERNGEHKIIKVKKDPGLPMGIDFTTDLFDGLYQCRNKCKFCFVYQIPKGMRRTLYLMDDDYRLSFLYGNFITLSNVSREDKERIKQLRLSPLYLSVHATEPETRRLLMDYRKNALGTIDPLEDIKEFVDAGIELHTQVVCCPGINDGAVLEQTIQDLSSLYPGVLTLGVVPVGLTKHRERAPNMRSYTKEESIPIINMVRQYQRKFSKTLGTRFVFLSDEWFRLAELAPPSYSHYEKFQQLDNGVGMLALWKSRFQALKRSIKPFKIFKKRKITIFTSPLGASLLREAASWLRNFKGLSIDVVVGRHLFWGDSVTIAGLFTGQDIRENLKGRELGDLLCLPSVMTKEGLDGKIFLDDCHVDDLEKELGVPVALIPYLNPRELYKTVTSGYTA